MIFFIVKVHHTAHLFYFKIYYEVTILSRVRPEKALAQHKTVILCTTIKFLQAVLQFTKRKAVPTNATIYCLHLAALPMD